MKRSPREIMIEHDNDDEGGRRWRDGTRPRFGEGNCQSVARNDAREDVLWPSAFGLRLVVDRRVKRGGVWPT